MQDVLGRTATLLARLNEATAVQHTVKVHSDELTPFFLFLHVTQPLDLPGTPTIVADLAYLVLAD